MMTAGWGRALTALAAAAAIGGGLAACETAPARPSAACHREVARYDAGVAEHNADLAGGLLPPRALLTRLGRELTVLARICPPAVRVGVLSR